MDHPYWFADQSQRRQNIGDIEVSVGRNSVLLWAAGQLGMCGYLAEKDVSDIHSMLNVEMTHGRQTSSPSNWM